MPTPTELRVLGIWQPLSASVLQPCRPLLLPAMNTVKDILV